MKPGKGKAKGSAFERTIAKQLSRWLTDGKDATQLVRSVLSGGWQGRGARHAGDLAANGPAGETFRQHFVVECKHNRNDLLWRLFTSRRGECLQVWWNKLSVEAAKLHRQPLLIFRQNGKPTVVVLEQSVSEPLALVSNFLTYRGDEYMRLFLLEDFLGQPPKVYYEAIKRFQLETGDDA